DHRLAPDRAALEFWRDLVHGGTMDGHAGRKNTRVGVQTGKERQDRGMDVEYPSLTPGDEIRRQHAHEPRETDDLGSGAVELPVEGGLETGAVRKGTVIEGDGGNPGAGGTRESGHFGAVRDDDAGTRRMRPVLHVGDEGRHVGAAARDQDRDGNPAHARVRPGWLVTWPSGRTSSPSARRRSVSAAARSGAATTTMPMPQLKVRRSSASAMRPASRSQAKTGGSGHAERSIVAPQPSGRMRGRFSGRPPPVTWASARTPPARIAARQGRT